MGCKPNISDYPTMLGQDPTYAYSNIGGRLKNRKTRFSDGLSVSKPAKPRPVTQTACVAAPHTLPWRLRLSESAASAQPNPLFRHSRAGGNLGGLGQLFISSKLPAIEKDSRLRGDDVSEKTKSVFFFFKWPFMLKRPNIRRLKNRVRGCATHPTLTAEAV